MVIGGLKPDTTYSITVAAYTTKGDGARSKPKLVVTKGAGQWNVCSNMGVFLRLHSSFVSEDSVNYVGISRQIMRAVGLFVWALAMKYQRLMFARYKAGASFELFLWLPPLGTQV